ncbi:MAG TPA: hypothetical protein VLM89_05970 [Phycisphaerae bacterium]|nr:hypothetical protein [Phycisphaerae bacterium]
MKVRIWGWMVVVLGAALVAGGDVVILRNGDRVEGEIVSESPAEVQIKRTFRGGIKFTEKIERSRIARIEKGESDEASATASSVAENGPQSRPAASQPTVLTDADRKELLETALGRWEKQDYAAAGMALSRLINGTPSADLNQISRELEKRIELSLGDLAAEAHLQAAIVKARGQSVVLQYVTEYERPNLVPRLVQAYEAALAKPAGADLSTAHPAHSRGRSTAKPDPGRTGHPAGRQAGGKQAGKEEVKLDETPPAEPASQPAVTLAGLLDNPESFTGDREQIIAVGRHIRHVMSLLSARTRYDNEYRRNPELREELRKERERLTALQKALQSKAGEAATGRESRERDMQGHGPGGMGGFGRPRPGEGEEEDLGMEGQENEDPAARGVGKALRTIRQRQESEEAGQPPPPPK